MRKLLLAFLLALPPIAALAGAPFPLVPGNNLSDIPATDQARANILLPDVAYDTADKRWGLSSTPASVAAGTPDHKGDIQNLNTIISGSAATMAR